MFKHFLFNTKTAGMDLSRSFLFKPSSFNYMTLTNRTMMLNKSLMPQYHSINHQAMMMFMGVQPRFTFIAKAPQGLSEYQSDKRSCFPSPLNTCGIILVQELLTRLLVAVPALVSGKTDYVCQ